MLDTFFTIGFYGSCMDTSLDESAVFPEMYTVDQCFSNFTVYTKNLGIVLRCRL